MRRSRQPRWTLASRPDVRFAPGEKMPDRGTLRALLHHSLIQYRLPGTGELIPLLQIAPSKTDTERLLGGRPGTGRCAERDHLPPSAPMTEPSPWSFPGTTTNTCGIRPMPLLFQRHLRAEDRADHRSGRPAAPSPDRPPTGQASPASRAQPPQVRPARLPPAVHHRRPSCIGCHRTSPSWSPVTATSTPPWVTKPSIPKRSLNGPPGLHLPPQSPAAQRGIPHPHR